MRKEGHCEAAVFLFCVLVQDGRVSLAKRGKLACPAGAQEGRHLRFPPSCGSPLSLGESGADCRHVTAAKRGTAEDFFSAEDELPSESVLLSNLFAGSDSVLLHRPESLRRRGITVPRNSLARCNARHLRIRRLVQFIFAGAVYHNALSNCAALLCRTQRRVARMCSRTLSDPANRLRKTRKKKSSAVLLFEAVTCRQSAPD